MRWANRRNPPSSLRRLLDEGIASLLRSCRMRRHHRTHIQDYQHLASVTPVTALPSTAVEVAESRTNQVRESPGRL